MKKIGLLIFFILLIILSGALLFFYKNNINAPANNLEKIIIPVDLENFSFIEEKDFSMIEKTQSYVVGQTEFRINPWIEETNTAGYFEVYNDGKSIFSSKSNYKVSGLILFNLGENKYVVVKDYSGGAHCCDTDYVFRINKNGDTKLIKTFDMGNASITKDSLVFKNNKLYFTLLDDRFQYFHMPYAYSYFFTRYFWLNGDEFMKADSDFKIEIEKTAQDCKEKIVTDSAQIDEQGNYWLKDMLCYVANSSLIGKQESAMKDFDMFFNKFFPNGSGKDAFGATINREELKQEIIETLKDGRFN